MALPRPLQVGLLPSEVEYLSTTETLVQIVPLLPIDRGIYGPFRPPALASVPLWLAVNLKGKNKCAIVPPEWLTVEALQDLVREETSSPRFAKVPLHYVAIAKVLLDASSDNIPQSSEVRALLKDLREARQSKVLAGLEHLNAVHLEMTNISLLEIAELRPFFTSAFRHLSTLSNTSEIGGVGGPNGGGLGGQGDDDDDDGGEVFLTPYRTSASPARQDRWSNKTVQNGVRAPFDTFAGGGQSSRGPSTVNPSGDPADYLAMLAPIADPFAEFDQQLRGAVAAEANAASPAEVDAARTAITVSQGGAALDDDSMDS